MSKQETVTKPTPRRGISNETKAVSQLTFHEKDAAPNGLFVGHLENVSVDWSTNEGTRIPRLTFHFMSNHSNPNEARHVYHTLFPVESNVDTIPGGKEEWKVNNVLNFIKHVLDVLYLKGRQLTDDEVNLLTLPFVDFDEDGTYIPLDPSEVINGYGTLFENTAALLNGTSNLADGESAKPCYKNDNGKPISLWMKLLRHRRNKNGWQNVGQNGNLGFDSFIGAGCIEIQKANTPPSVLRIDLSKESITPKETKKQPVDNLMSMAGGVIPNMSTMAMGSENTAFSEAGDGMPF